MRAPLTQLSQSPASRTPGGKTNGQQRTPVHHAHTAHNTSRQVLRTVYLPNERSDALVLMVESLSSQLSEHKQLSSQHATTLRGEFEDREKNLRKRVEEDAVVISDLSTR